MLRWSNSLQVGFGLCVWIGWSVLGAVCLIVFIMIRRPPRSTQSRSSAASDVYKRQMQGHTLMQAIARVNRIYKGKAGGLIVDYIGIASDLSLIHISEPTRLLSTSYAVFCLKKKTYPHMKILTY